MEYTEIIYLIEDTITTDDIGNSILSVGSSTKCYAKKQSVKTNEFYNASMTGLSLSCEFVVKRLNYNGQNQLKWNNELFEIIRTIDPKNKNDIVLVCSKKIGIKEDEVSA